MIALIKRMKDLHAFSGILEAVAGKLTDAERERVEDLIAGELGLLIADDIDIAKEIDKRAEGSDFAELERKLKVLRLANDAAYLANGSTQTRVALYALHAAVKELLECES